ncbi:FtsQ-type POTRA domain-containing protein [Microbacterium sp. YY-01]|uniref:FtsQ-type POTRA domain-containing protein n=1 Tax=Microbacterium sp. YY-01 TaxID=3421634 RepID=UPI003D180623
MRRPSPIPSSPRRPEVEPHPEPVLANTRSLLPVSHRGGDAADDAVAQDDQPTVPVAPILPLTSASHEGSAAHHSSSAPDAESQQPLPGDDVTHGSGDEPADRAAVGTWDVWKAARARRRALRAEIRRFTHRARRRRRMILAWLGAAVVVAVTSFAVAYSPLFAVDTITVTGVQQLDPATIESALEQQRGRPLALVDSGEVKAALVAFPLIETYTLEAHPPHELMVKIVERTPVGVVATDAGFTVIDAAGVALSTSEQRPEGHALLTIEGGIGTRAFVSAGNVVRSLPESIAARLVEVAASSVDDVTLTLDDRTQVVWGSAHESVRKGIALERTMQAHPNADVYDVSSPQAVVVR